MVSFHEQIQDRTENHKTVLCIGLDTTLENVPASLQSETNPQLAWNKAIIDATNDIVCCYKPNFAFYLNDREYRLKTLKETIDYAHIKEVPVIIDAKFGDIGHTASYYAKAAFEYLEADAVTVNPYMGEETIAPFREYQDRGIFILCLTSNVSRIDFQTKMIDMGEFPEIPLFVRVANKIKDWNQTGNLGAVVGATAPEELALVREVLGPDISVLCPGIGVQGGDLEEVLWSAYTKPGSLLVNVSRAIINVSRGENFAEASRNEAIMFVNQFRNFLDQLAEEPS